MTEIVRGDGMKYALAYNEFHNLESIGIEGKVEKLIQYTYKAGNGRLKEMKYANGDTMKATYNSIGQMVAEKWYNSTNILTAHYKYVYDGEGNIVRSIDILGNNLDWYASKNIPHRNALIPRQRTHGFLQERKLCKVHIRVG